jgi:hypothetical protein
MQFVSKQRNCKDVYNNRCFPWCLCRVLIREVNSDVISVQGSYELKQTVAHCRCMEVVKLLRHLLSWYSLIRTCNSVH